MHHSVVQSHGFWGRLFPTISSWSKKWNSKLWFSSAASATLSSRSLTPTNCQLGDYPWMSCPKRAEVAYILQGVLHPDLCSVICSTVACLSFQLCCLFTLLIAVSPPAILYFHLLSLSFATARSQLTFVFQAELVSTHCTHNSLGHFLGRPCGGLMPHLHDYIRFFFSNFLPLAWVCKTTRGNFFASIDYECAGEKMGKCCTLVLKWLDESRSLGLLLCRRKLPPPLMKHTSKERVCESLRKTLLIDGSNLHKWLRKQAIKNYKLERK